MKNPLLKLCVKFACWQNLFKRKYILLIDNTFNNEAELVDNYSLFEYLQSQDEYENISFYVINRYNSNYDSIANKYKNNIIPIENSRVNLALVLKLFKTKYWLDSFQVINRFNINLKKYFFPSRIIPIYMQHGINFFKLFFLGDDSIGDGVFKKIVFSNEKERELYKKYYGYNDKIQFLSDYPVGIE